MLEPIGTRIVLAGEEFRFGHGRSGTSRCSARMGFEVRPVPIVQGRVLEPHPRALLREATSPRPRACSGVPELEGTSSAATSAAGRSATRPRTSLCPRTCSSRSTASTQAPPADDPRRTSAVSIGVNPHYGGNERRIEAFLLDFEGDLYGQQLRLELWDGLRESGYSTASRPLVGQIARDVAAHAGATPPPL